LTEGVNKVELRGYGFEKQSWFGHVCVKKNRDFLKGLEEWQQRGPINLRSRDVYVFMVSEPEWLQLMDRKL